MWWKILAALGTLVIILFILGIVILAAFLHWATGILKFPKRSFGLALASVLIMIVVDVIVPLIFSWIPVIGWIIGFLISLFIEWLIIKSFYNVSWGKAIAAWLLSIVLAIVVIGVLAAALLFLILVT